MSPPLREIPAATRAAEAPGRSVQTDLETLAALDLEPDYVLAFTPPRVCERIRDRLTLPGWWELLAITDYNAGDCASDDWTWQAPRETAVDDLAAWASSLLGCPVALEADTTEIKTSGRFARWHEEPLYWVRRDK